MDIAVWIHLGSVTERRRIVYRGCTLSLITVFSLAAVVAASAAVRRIDIRICRLVVAGYHRIGCESANARNTEFAVCTLNIATAAMMDIADWIDPGTVTNRRRIVYYRCTYSLITVSS